MRKKGKETLQKTEDNARKISQAGREVLQQLDLNPNTHEQFLRGYSKEFELVDKFGKQIKVHLVVLGNLHCRNSEDYLFIGIVEKRRLKTVLGKLTKGTNSQKNLCLAWKEFFLIRDRKRPTEVTSKSRIHIEHKMYQSIGIGTSLFLISEEIRNTVLRQLATTLRIRKLRAQIFDENGGADWTARLVEKHFPFYIEQKERGLFEYIYQF